MPVSILAFLQSLHPCFAAPIGRRAGYPSQSLPRRSLRMESLEMRALLVAEAQPFDLPRTLDVTGLAGTPTATVQWGDGTQSAATVTGGTTSGNVRIRFDYSLDTSGFLSAADRR